MASIREARCNKERFSKISLGIFEVLAKGTEWSASNLLDPYLILSADNHGGGG